MEKLKMASTFDISHTEKTAVGKHTKEPLNVGSIYSTYAGFKTKLIKIKGQRMLTNE